MTERDAFGNPIEDAQPGSQPLASDDPLTSGDPLIVADPVAAPASTPAAEPSPPRRPRRMLGLAGLIGLLLFLAPFLIGGWFVYKSISDTVDHTTGVLRDLSDRTTTVTGSDGSGTANGERTAGPPRGLQRGSLLRPAAVDAVLRKVRADPGGKLLLLRLAPERADLQLSRPGGGMSIVQLRFDGNRSLVRTSAGGSTSKSITFSKIDRDAPTRLVRAAARRLGRKTSSIDYLVLFNVLNGPTWSAYFTGGAAFQGDAHGKIVRRIQ